MIHPETWASFDNLNGLNDLRRGEPLQVAPTASTRTVLTTETSANVPQHFVKLHYPRRISRLNRRLRRKNIRSSKESAVRGRVAEAFHRNFPDADVFLPGDTTYYFSNERLPGNEFRLVDTKRAPEWR